MGYDIQLIPKTRDDEILLKIMECTDKNVQRFFSDNFALFQSRFVFDQSEFKQVQELLSIDLSIYLKYPKNHLYDISELEYKLYLAEEKNNLTEIEKIKIDIEDEIENWDLAYKTNNEGWSRINDFRRVTINFIEAIKQNPEFGSKIFVPKVQDFPWGNYFSIKEKKDKNDHRIIDDLNFLLFKLQCIEKYEVEYVGFVGG
ncbi:MAG: hypothetical protein AB8H03_21460 [Saprospiraceae bacterium]